MYIYAMHDNALRAFPKRLRRVTTIVVLWPRHSGWPGGAKGQVGLEAVFVRFLWAQLEFVGRKSDSTFGGVNRMWLPGNRYCRITPQDMGGVLSGTFERPHCPSPPPPPPPHSNTFPRRPIPPRTGRTWRAQRKLVRAKGKHKGR